MKRSKGFESTAEIFVLTGPPSTAKSMNIIQALKSEALEAHSNGLRWEAFWPTVAVRIQKAEPRSWERYRELLDRLLHLLTTGEPSGQESPPIAEPWEHDDHPETMPNDRKTSNSRRENRRRYIHFTAPRCPVCGSADLRCYRSSKRISGTVKRHTECRVCKEKFYLVVE